MSSVAESHRAIPGHLTPFSLVASETFSIISEQLDSSGISTTASGSFAGVSLLALYALLVVPVGGRYNWTYSAPRVRREIESSSKLGSFRFAEGVV